MISFVCVFSLEISSSSSFSFASESQISTRFTTISRWKYLYDRLYFTVSWTEKSWTRSRNDRSRIGHHNAIQLSLERNQSNEKHRFFFDLIVNFSSFRRIFTSKIQQTSFLVIVLLISFIEFVTKTFVFVFFLRNSFVFIQVHSLDLSKTTEIDDRQELNKMLCGIARMWVHPDHRRARIATKLLDCVR